MAPIDSIDLVEKYLQIQVVDVGMEMPARLGGLNRNICRATLISSHVRGCCSHDFFLGQDPSGMEKQSG